jgi:hypothetical protein
MEGYICNVWVVIETDGVEVKYQINGGYRKRGAR